MNNSEKVVLLAAIASMSVIGQVTQLDSDKANQPSGPPLDQVISHFELKNGALIDGLSELSRNLEVHLHLGIEEALRERFDSPRDRSVHFSVHLEKKSVREILDALCQADTRYSWKADGLTIELYPRTRLGDKTDLLNFQIPHIQLGGTTDADQAIAPLLELFPWEPIGYMQVGLGEYDYDAPWTTTFDDLTVRQFIDRVSEHMGPDTVWLWQGGKDGRLFTFLKGGFYSH